MREVKNDRLFMALGGLIFQGMKKAIYYAPTPEELYALEKRAREERARQVAAMLAAAAGALKSALNRAVSALNAKVVRHA